MYVNMATISVIKSAKVVTKEFSLKISTQFVIDSIKSVSEIDYSELLRYELVVRIYMNTSFKIYMYIHIPIFIKYIFLYKQFVYIFWSL